MAKKDNTISCDIFTPDGQVASGEYTCVNIPALDGYIGVLANRAPVTAVITTGLLTLTTTAGKAEELFVSRGFLRVAMNKATILAEECLPVKKLDPEKAWDLLQKAYKMPRQTREQEDLREESIQAARKRFGIAQKARKKKVSMEDMFTKGL